MKTPFALLVLGLALITLLAFTGYRALESPAKVLVSKHENPKR